MRAARAAAHTRKADDVAFGTTVAARPRPLSASPHRAGGGGAPVSKRTTSHAVAHVEATGRISRKKSSATKRSRKQQGSRNSPGKKYRLGRLVLRESTSQSRFPMPYPGIDGRDRPPLCRTKSPARNDRSRSRWRRIVSEVSSPKKKRSAVTPVGGKGDAEHRKKVDPSVHVKTWKSLKRPRSAHVARFQDYADNLPVQYTMVSSSHHEDHGGYHVGSPTSAAGRGVVDRPIARTDNKHQPSGQVGQRRQRGRPSSAPFRNKADNTEAGELAALSRIADGSYTSSGELRILKWVVLRETYLDKLHGVVSARCKRANAASRKGVTEWQRSEKERAKIFNLLEDLLTVLRRVTVEIVEAVEKWRGPGSKKPFMWGTSNYLVKAAGDVEFLSKLSGLEEHLGVAIADNPFFWHVRLDGRPAFLSPRRKGDGREETSGGGVLGRRSYGRLNASIASKSLGVSPERVEMAAAVFYRELQLTNCGKVRRTMDTSNSSMRDGGTDADNTSSDRCRPHRSNSGATLHRGDRHHTRPRGSRMNQSSLRRQSTRSTNAVQEEHENNAYTEEDCYQDYYYQNPGDAEEHAKSSELNCPGTNAMEPLLPSHEKDAEVPSEEGRVAAIVVQCSPNGTSQEEDTLATRIRETLADRPESEAPEAKTPDEEEPDLCAGASKAPADANGATVGTAFQEMQRTCIRRGSPFAAIHSICDGLLTDLQANGLGVKPNAEEDVTEDEWLVLPSNEYRREAGGADGAMTSWEMETANKDKSQEDACGASLLQQLAIRRKQGFEILADFRGKIKRSHLNHQHSDDNHDDNDDVDVYGNSSVRSNHDQISEERKVKAFVGWAQRTKARQKYRGAKAARHRRRRILKEAVSIWASLLAKDLHRCLGDAFCGQFGLSDRFYMRATFDALRVHARGAHIAARHRPTVQASSDRLEIIGRVRVRQAWQRWAKTTTETTDKEHVQADATQEGDSMVQWLTIEEENSKSLSSRDAVDGTPGVTMGITDGGNIVSTDRGEDGMTEASTQGTTVLQNLGAKLDPLKSFHRLISKSQLSSFRGLTVLTAHIMKEPQATNTATPTPFTANTTTGVTRSQTGSTPTKAELERERKLMRELEREIDKTSVAATSIQRSWRAKRVRPVVARATMSARLIQRVWRLRVKRGRAGVRLTRAWRCRAAVRSRALSQALAEAAGAGDLKAVSFLLREKTIALGVSYVPGADVNSMVIGSAGPSTPLHIACRGESELFDGQSSRSAAASKGTRTKGVASWTTKNNERLGVADWVGVIKALVQAGAALEATDGDGKTPMMAAAEGGSGETVAALAGVGAEIDAVETAGEGRTPLVIAAQQANAQAAATLLKYGAQVNRATEDGLTPLHEAASAGSVEVAEILVRAGAKFDAQTKSAGMTPLHLAIANGQRSVARLLIHSGADVSLPEKRGLTPLRLAVEMADKATVELLLMAKSPAELDIQDKEGSTVLHAACRQGLTEIAQLLLEAGANPHIRDKAGRAPELVALDFDQTDCATLFYNLAFVPSTGKSQAEPNYGPSANNSETVSESTSTKRHGNSSASGSSDGERQYELGGRSGSRDDSKGGREEQEVGIWVGEHSRLREAGEASSLEQPLSNESSAEPQSTGPLGRNREKIDRDSWRASSSSDTGENKKQEGKKGRAEAGRDSDHVDELWVPVIATEREILLSRGRDLGEYSAESGDERQENGAKRADQDVDGDSGVNDGEEWAWTETKGWRRLRVGLAHAVAAERQLSSMRIAGYRPEDGQGPGDDGGSEWAWTTTGGWQKVQFFNLAADGVGVEQKTATATGTDNLGTAGKSSLHHGEQAPIYEEATDHGAENDRGVAGRGWVQTSTNDPKDSSNLAVKDDGNQEWLSLGEDGRLQYSDAADVRHYQREGQNTEERSSDEVQDETSMRATTRQEDNYTERGEERAVGLRSSALALDSDATQRQLQDAEEGQGVVGTARAWHDFFDPQRAPATGDTSRRRSSNDEWDEPIHSVPDYDYDKNKSNGSTLTITPENEPRPAERRQDSVPEGFATHSTEPVDVGPATHVRTKTYGRGGLTGILKAESKWMALVDPDSGSTYYLDQQSGLTQWEIPDGGVMDTTDRDRAR